MGVNYAHLFSTTWTTYPASEGEMAYIFWMPFTLILQTERHYYKPVASSVSLVLLFQLFRATIKKKVLLVKMAHMHRRPAISSKILEKLGNNNGNNTCEKTPDTEGCIELVCVLGQQ